MKFYSEMLNKVYDTAEACQKAEFEAKEAENRERIRKEREARIAKEKQEKAVAARKGQAAKVEEARKAMIAAQNKYREELEAFCKNYGTYHYSLNGEDAKHVIPTLFDIFNSSFLDF